MISEWLSGYINKSFSKLCPQKVQVRPAMMAQIVQEYEDDDMRYNGHK